MAELEQLIEKWNLRRSYHSKSICCPAWSPNGRNYTVGVDKTYEEIYGEIPPFIVVELLPQIMVNHLLKSRFTLRYCNASGQNFYDAKTHSAVVKDPSDILHEIGHGLWYDLVPEEEKDQKEAVIKAIAPDHSRVTLVERAKIPSFHCLYAQLVGAFSGQFLELGKSYAPQNSVEELFARNFDYLLKGKPLQVTPNCRVGIDRILGFYLLMGMIDEPAERFYRTSIQRGYSGKALLPLPIEKMTNGDMIDTDLLKRIKSLKGQLR